MSNFNFRKAEKKSAVLKLAFMGVAGSGKTYSALKIATSLVNPDEVAAIDTERSIAKYADIFPVNVLDWDLSDQSNQIELLIEAISIAEKKFKIIVIDSLSFFWSWLVEYVDTLTKTRFNGNSFMGWGVGTPLQKKLIQKILSSPSHIIVTFRAKTEWVISQDGGKMKVVRAGLGAEQGKNIEYEFDLLGVLSEEHLCDFRKDRFGKFQDRIVKIDDKFCKEVVNWLSETNKIETETEPQIKKKNKQEKQEQQEQQEQQGQQEDIEKLILEIEKKIEEIGKFEYVIKFENVKKTLKTLESDEKIKKLNEIKKFLEKEAQNEL